MILAIKHHQQSGEAAVRDIGICARTGRGDEQASALTCNRSLVLGGASNKLKHRMMSEDRTPKPNTHRGPNFEARTAQALKQDSRGNDTKGFRVRSTKEKATMNMEETLAMFGSNKVDCWKDAKKRCRSTELKKAKDLRIDMQTAKRGRIKEARDLRIAKNHVVVSVDRVTAVIGYFPLKYDGKVKLTNLRYTDLKGFVCLQLKKRGIPYEETEDGSTGLGVTALKNKLVAWNDDKHKDRQTVPEDVEVLLDDGEMDYEGEQWTIEKVYDIIASKTSK